jgi:membrane protease YdiL (CAAX protease family)
MSLPLSLVLFGLPALSILLLQQVVVPRLDASGVPPLVNFLVLALPLFLMLVAALGAYRLEGNPWSLAVLAARFRLKKLNGRDWLWTVAAAAGNIGSYLLVYTAARPLLEWLHERFPDPECLGRIFGDAETFLGYPLAGNAWLLGVFFVYYFFNVVGEELWWRGYIFPRQELTHGSRTWIVHGLLWAAFHLFTPYNAVMVLPGALWLSWIVQRRGNTSIFLVAHAAMNGLVMVRIVSGIVG